MDLRENQIQHELELAEKCVEYETRTLEHETEIAELRESLEELLAKHEEQETRLSVLREQNRRHRRREFDWTAKKKEHKAMLVVPRAVREPDEAQPDVLQAAVSV